MRKNNHYKSIFLICVLLLAWHVTSTCIAEENKLNWLMINADSYDYSSYHDWGFCQTAGELDSLNGQSHIIYSDMSSEQLDDYVRNPEQWYKCWIRIWVQPGVGWASEYGDDDMNPLSYADLHINNVRICNADEIGMYPKSYMMFAANPSAFSEMSVQNKDGQGDLWYMEVVIESRNRTEEEIESAVQQAEVLCDVSYFGYAQSYTKEDVSISLSSIERKVFFDKNDIGIFATKISKSDVDISEIFANYLISDEVLEKLETSPETFQCYQIQLYISNSGAYDILNVSNNPIQCCEYVWLLYYELEFDSIVQCKSGTDKPLKGYYLIVMNQNTNQTLTTNTVKSLPLTMRAFTEFAGIINEEDDEGTLGCNGIPFVVEIDLTSHLAY